MRRTFVYTGGLAAAAVLGLGAASPAAAACGQPAQPAVYSTVVVPAVTETVPATTRVESLWSREVSTTRREATRTTPGHDVLRWSRTAEQRELEYSEKVIDQEYVPAVPETPAVWRTDTVVIPAVTMTLFEFFQMINVDNRRWEEEGWNAGPKGKGWSPTGATDLVVIEPERTEEVEVLVSPAIPGTPEVPEVSHLEFHWLPEGDAPAAGLIATGASRLVPGDTETVDLPEGDTPAGDGWVQGAVVDTVAAVVETIWLDEGETTPDGFSETGVVEVLTVPETTSASSAEAPAGEGWARVADSEVTVEVTPEQVVVVSPASSTRVLVTPAVPAESCSTAGGGSATAPGSTSGSTTRPVAVTTAVAGALPATGSPVTPGVLAAALTSLLAGIVLVRRSRRVVG